jgi:hypothetical protein
MNLQKSQTSIVEHPNARKEVEIHLQGALRNQAQGHEAGRQPAQGGVR